MDPVFRLPPWNREVVLSALSDRELGWGSRQFRIPEAWKNTPRGAGTRIAVLDTGCDERHPDLEGQILESHDFTRSPYGPADVQGHGTHCAGVIGAKENDRGIVGVCPDLAQNGGGLLIGKVLGDDGSGRGDWIAAGIDWALDNGASIISMSLGSPMEDRHISAAVARAIQKGSHVICAAGNEGRPDSVGYPAALPGTIAVGAVNSRGEVAAFSSRGDQVDIAAPGENILSTFPKGQYARLSGTSMATPFVTGVIGLMLSAGRTFDLPQDLRSELAAHATDAGDPGKDDDYGFGLIDPVSLTRKQAASGIRLGPFGFNMPAKAGDLLSITIGGTATDRPLPNEVSQALAVLQSHYQRGQRSGGRSV